MSAYLIVCVAVPGCGSAASIEVDIEVGVGVAAVVACDQLGAGGRGQAVELLDLGGWMLGLGRELLAEGGRLSEHVPAAARPLERLEEPAERATDTLEPRQPSAEGLAHAMRRLRSR